MAASSSTCSGLVAARSAQVQKICAARRYMSNLDLVTLKSRTWPSCASRPESPPVPANGIQQRPRSDLIPELTTRCPRLRTAKIHSCAAQNAPPRNYLIERHALRKPLRGRHTRAHPPANERGASAACTSHHHCAPRTHEKFCRGISPRVGDSPPRPKGSPRLAIGTTL